MKLNDIMYKTEDLAECIISFLEHADKSAETGFYMCMMHMGDDELRCYIKNWVETHFKRVKE